MPLMVIFSPTLNSSTFTDLLSGQQFSPTLAAAALLVKSVDTGFAG